MAVQNPNNWHWVDKNCIVWARAYFDEKLKTISGTDETTKTDVEITNVKSLTGDCEVCQRKGKVISLFDMALEINYESSTGHKGTISIPEIMYDTEPDGFQFNLDHQVDEPSRGVIKSKIIPQIRQILEDFGPTLINVHGSDIQVDESQVMSTFTKGNQNLSYMKPVVKEKTTFNKSAEGEKKNTDTKSSLPAYAQKYNTANLKLSTEYNTTAEQLYLTLLDPQRVAMWTRSAPMGIEPRVGAEFKLFGGGVEGKITRLVENKEIEMLWRLSSWKEGHYVKVTFKLNQGQSETIMDVDMNGVPIGDEELVENNFRDKYFRAIKITFGFGAVL
jgi:activator of HSP90 ATPase